MKLHVMIDCSGSMAEAIYSEGGRSRFCSAIKWVDGLLKEEWPYSSVCISTFDKERYDKGTAMNFNSAHALLNMISIADPAENRKFQKELTEIWARRGLIESIRSRARIGYDLSTALATMKAEGNHAAVQMLEQVIREQEQQAQTEGEKPQSPGTLLWDCLDRVAQESEEDEETLVLCITDGEDNGSLKTREDVHTSFGRKPWLKLRIVMISNTPPKADDEQDNLWANVTDNEDFKRVVRSSLRRTVQCESEGALRISIPIIPLVPCTQCELDAIRSAVRRAVPYLERLTTLRYYPVTTYIIDEFTLRQSSPAQLDNVVDKTLDRDLYEIMSFLWAACVSFHITASRNRVTWGNVLKGNDSQMKLRAYAEEVMQNIEKYLLHDRMPDTRTANRVCIPELSTGASFAQNSHLNLRAIGKILGQTASAEPAHELERLHAYLEQESGWKMPCAKPNLESWRRRLTSKEFSRLRSCIDKEGRWRMRSRDIARAFKIGVDVLFPLIRQWRRTNSRYARIIDEIRTYGFYVPAWGSGSEEQVRKIMIERGLPEQLWMPFTGKVFICIERIRHRAAEMAAGDIELENEFTTQANQKYGVEGKVPPLFDATEWFEKLLDSTIVHEHAHAITTEGVSAGQAGKQYCRIPGAQTTEWTAVSETLAEWAELNFFRNDPVMFEAVALHAGAGPFPAWPYAGALMLEESSFADVTALFRNLLEQFRAKSENAYQMLAQEDLGGSQNTAISSCVEDGVKMENPDEALMADTPSIPETSGQP